MLSWSPLATMRSRCGGYSFASRPRDLLPRYATDHNKLGVPCVANQCLYARLGCEGCWEALVDRSDGREIVVGTAMGLVIGILLSWGAVYGLNRYLGPDAETYETTGSARAPDPFN
jgi:hypothetical protein